MKPEQRKGQIDRKRLDGAERDLRRIQQEIAPFAKRRGYTRQTTLGQWRETASALKNAASHDRAR
jgi:hypothetical protein